MYNFMDSIFAIILIAAVVLLGLFAMGALDNDGVIQVDQMEYTSGGFTFSGELRNGQFSGDGTINFQDGSRYSGGFVDGRFDGRATFNNIGDTDNGDWRFDGIFQNGRVDSGTFHLNDGVEITFDHSQPEGTVISPTWQYSGSFNESGKNGMGSFTFEDGSVYVGEFLDGLAHGQGIFTSSEGWSYEGSFKDGMFDGEGEMKRGYSINRGIWDRGVQITRYE